MTKKKWIIVALAIIVIVAGAIGGYIWYQNDQRQKILDSIQLTFTDQTVVEYGSHIKAEDFELVDYDPVKPQLKFDLAI